MVMIDSDGDDGAGGAGGDVLIFVQAAITNYHRLDESNNKHLLLIVLEAGGLRSACQHGWVPDESPLLGLQTAVLPCLPWWKESSSALWLLLRSH